MNKTIAKISIIILLLSCFLLFPISVLAIPTLGVAPGNPADESYANLSFDGFPMPLSGGELTIWYGSNSGKINYVPSINDLWLLTTSAAGAGFNFEGLPFSLQEDLSVASYKDPVYGVNLTDNGFPFPTAWSDLDETFYSYEFGEGKKAFEYITGELSAPGIQVGDWMYAVLEGNSVDAFSPKTTSSMATPEPATMLLLGSGLMGLAVVGRKKLFKK